MGVSDFTAGACSLRTVSGLACATTGFLIDVPGLGFVVFTLIAVSLLDTN